MHGRFTDLRRFMDDFGYENCVTRDQGKMGKLFPVFSITALVILLVFLNGIPILFGFNIIYFTGMLSFGLCYLEYRLIKSLNIEYQFELSDGQFEVSKITNKKKIELLASFPVKECEYIGPVTSDRFGDDVGKSEYVLNCTSIRKFEMNDDTWYFFLTQEKVTYIIVFDFDDQLYPYLRRYNPRGTKRIDV